MIVTHDPMLVKKVDRVVAIRDGKTSSEILRRKSYEQELLEQEQGTQEQEEESHVEYAVLDQAGRLQIPANYLEAIGAKQTNKVQVTMEDGKIVLMPPHNS